MDSPPFNSAFYCDSKPPFNNVSGSVITLTTSYQAICPTGNLPWFPANYFTPGKLLYIKHIFSTTSGATPGGLFAELLFGSNAAGAGQVLASAGITWTANEANVACCSDWWVRCRSPGPAGLLFSYGVLFIGGTGLIPVPATGGLGALTIDTTQGGYIAPQYYRSGSTAETIQHHDIMYRAMN